MTREEAKIFLLQLHTDKQLNKSEHEALRMAIKTLEQEPCEDVISRVETVRFLANHSKDFVDARYRMAYMSASSLVNNPHNLPSVTPQPKTGHWIFIGNSDVNGLKICECDVCGKRTYGSHNFCPNCGAKMEVKE